KTGALIIAKALSAPLKQIAENAGMEGAIILKDVEDHKGNYGYDALRDKFCDMIETGILDPKKVVRCALENAASIASLLITTEATIVDVPEAKESAPAMPAGMGGGMGGMY
ncbi:MAG: chaperonin GroEL, partial [Waddliaceae bacterium]|nr:chaperonin GroEL [Waddliaceae bacterium]